MDFLKETSQTISNIFKRVKTKDFSGEGGMALKNSSYQVSKNLIAKLGSLVFMIILARILKPELFGLYSLILATVSIFVVVSDLGLGTAMVKFVSSELGKKKPQKAKSYYKYILKIKLIFMAVASVLLLSLSGFLSNEYYQKPIFLGLIAGILYLFFSEMTNMFLSVFQATNKFRTTLYQEAIFQISRILFVVSLVFLSFRYLLGDEKTLFFAIGGLSIAYAISWIFYLSSLKKTGFLKEKQVNLSKKEKKILGHFLLAVSLTALSGAFFGQVDKIILGSFVTGEFIGYYSAAYSIIVSFIPLITLSTVFLPIFSRSNKNKLNVLFNKSVGVMISISFVLSLLVFIFSPLIIQIIFGVDYILSANILRWFAVLILILPLISFLSTYFVSIGKPAVVTRLLAISTLLNVILNFVFISVLISRGLLYAVYGAVFATLISKVFYLAGLSLAKRKITNK